LERGVLVSGWPGILTSFEQVVFVGNIEGGKHGQAHRVDGIGGLGNGAHLGVDVLSQFEDVLGIGPAQIVSLIEDLDAHTTVLGVFHRCIFRRRSHDPPAPFVFATCGLTKCRASLLPVPLQSTRSAPASSRPGRGFLPALFAVARPRAGAYPAALRALPTAGGRVGHRARPQPGPAAPPCTSLWCDKPSLPTPQNRPLEPGPPPAPPPSTP